MNNGLHLSRKDRREQERRKEAARKKVENDLRNMCATVLTAFCESKEIEGVDARGFVDQYFDGNER